MKRSKKLLALILIFSLQVEPAFAATSKPSPVSSKKSTPKVTTKSNSKVSLKPKQKKVVPKTYHRKYVRKYVKPIPSPDPLWPPPNFSNNGSIYAKVPSAEELKGAASNSKTLTAGLATCEGVTCGAVFVASEKGCAYWEIDSVVSQVNETDPNSKDPIGTLRTLDTGSGAKKIKIILLISQAPLAPGVTVGGISAKCWQASPGDKVPTNIYTPIAPHN
jgi:hypothetical protein